MRYLAYITLIVMLGVLVDIRPGRNTVNAAELTSAALSIVWPADENLPYTVHSVAIEVRQGETLLVRQIANRPEAGGTQTVILANLPVGELVCTFTAYDTLDGGGASMASGQGVLLTKAGIRVSAKVAIEGTVTKVIILSPPGQSGSMSIGQSRALIATTVTTLGVLVLQPANGVRWTSTNAAVISVDGSGTVQALKSGTAIIAATVVNGGASGRFSMSVSGVDTTIVRIEVSPVDIALDVDATLQVSALGRNAANDPIPIAAENLTWRSGNDAVASVSATGLLTGLAAGTTRVYARESVTGLIGSTAVTVATAPSGKLIAFISERDGDKELFVMNEDGSNQRQLTFNDAWEDECAWTPDGTQLAYISNRNVADKTRWSFDIFMMNVDGTNDRQVTFNSLAEWGPSFSPDGTKVLYFMSRSVANGRDEIYLANANWSKPKMLIGGPGLDVIPSFTPDMTQIVFASDRRDPGSQEYDLYIADADGGNQQALTSDPGKEWYFTISPDGQWLVFSCSGGKLDIMRLDGTERRTLPTPPGLCKQPSFSPDGTSLVFANSNSGNWDIYTMKLDGTNVKRLTAGPSSSYMPKWQP